MAPEGGLNIFFFFNSGNVNFGHLPVLFSCYNANNEQYINVCDAIDTRANNITAI